LLVAAALGGAWFMTGEGMILLVGIVAVFRGATKSADAPPDRIAFGSFLILVAGLSALACVRGQN
jgi:hypothetical protein